MENCRILKTSYFLITKWLSLCAWLIIRSAQAVEPVLPSEAQAGDLIFREGTEWISAAVMSVDGGGFSHVGMLIGEAGSWQVLHATPAERSGQADGVALDTLAFFLDPQRSHAHAVYQVQATLAQRQRAVQFALAEHGKSFRIHDAAGTYCTVLVWNAWQQAGVDLQVRFTPVALPLMRGNYLLPSNLRHSPQLQRLESNALIESVRID